MSLALSFGFCVYARMTYSNRFCEAEKLAKHASPGAASVRGAATASHGCTQGVNSPSPGMSVETCEEVPFYRQES